MHSICDPHQNLKHADPMTKTAGSFPKSDMPISEQYRLAARQWVDLDGAARLLEETKTAVMSQRMKALGDKPAAHAERDVKASPEWKDFVTEMVQARTAANLAKVKLEWVRMRFSEEQSNQANARHEGRLTR